MSAVNPNASGNNLTPMSPEMLGQAQQIANQAHQSMASQLADGTWNLSKALIEMNFYDPEAGERLNLKEKVTAGGLGLVSLIAFSHIAHSLAGLDSNFGTINPVNQAQARYSPLGRIANAIDKIGGERFKQGGFANLPTWMRAYLGDLTTQEYNEMWLKNHQQAVVATIHKLTKEAKSPEALPLRYAQHYLDVAEVLKNSQTAEAYMKHLHPHELAHVTQELMQPFLDFDPKGYANDPSLKPIFEKIFNEEINFFKQAPVDLQHLQNERLKILPHDTEALQKIDLEIKKLQAVMAVKQHTLFKNSALANSGQVIEDFETFIQRNPKKLKDLVMSVPKDSPHYAELQKEVIAYAHRVNAPSVKEAYLQQMHKRLFQFWGNVDVVKAQAIQVDHEAQVAHSLKATEKTVAQLAEVGNKTRWIPFSKTISKWMTPSHELDALKNKALLEVEQNETVWKALMGETAVSRYKDDLQACQSVKDFFKLHNGFSKQSQGTLKSFKDLHKVLPRSLKRSMQNIAEHEQFIQNQETLSEAWGVKGLGRSVASAWRGMIDMVKFNLHDTPNEALKNRAMAMASLRHDGSNALIKQAKGFANTFLKNPMQLGFFLGAVQAFSAGYAAFMAAGKVKGKEKDTGEKSKSFLRAFLASSIPCIGAAQLMLFLNRGNRLGKLMGSHYLTSFRFPLVGIGPHWLTLAGAVIAIGWQLGLCSVLRNKLEKLQDKTVGKPQYLVEYEEKDKVRSLLNDIKNREFESLKKEDLALIAKYPEVAKKEKIELSPAQIEEAYRLAGQKKARQITPQEAALLYALAQSAKQAPPSVPPQRVNPVNPQSNPKAS